MVWLVVGEGERERACEEIDYKSILCVCVCVICVSVRGGVSDRRPYIYMCVSVTLLLSRVHYIKKHTGENKKAKNIE